MVAQGRQVQRWMRGEKAGGKRTLLDERGQGADVAVLLREARLGSGQILLLLLVLNPQELVVVRVDVRCLVADDRLHVLILRLLLQVVELEIAQK